MPKFRIKKVNRFGYKGKHYKPGDIVELPESYAGYDFTEPVAEKKKKPEAKKPAKK